ncbi:uncharacterized protein METZ01_LOCUS474081, partial [marine metagenome]
MHFQSNIDLSHLGITQDKNINRNLSMEKLVEETVLNGEGVLGLNGAVMVDTGSYTGRSPDDKYFVDETSSTKNLWWGPVNKKVDEKIFNELYNKVIKYYNNNNESKTYVFDGFAGADPEHRLNVRVLAKKSWQAHFCHNMFIRPNLNELVDFEADFTIINASDVKNENYLEHGLNSDTFILFHLGRKIAIIGGTEYGGEMKKGIFL